MLRGTALNFLRQSGKETSKVFKLGAHGGEPIVFADGLRVLAGSVVVPADKALWVSELTQLVRVPLAPKNDRDWRRVEPFDQRMLADNLSVVDGSCVLKFPYYRAVSRIESAVFTNTRVASTLYDTLRAPCCAMLDRIDAPPLTAAPDRFEDVAYAAYDVRTGDIVNLKIDVEQKGFDGHVTHVEPYGRNLEGSRSACTANRPRARLSPSSPVVFVGLGVLPGRPLRSRPWRLVPVPQPAGES